MKLYKKYKVADAVLAVIEIVLTWQDTNDDDWKNTVYCSTYSNGRENGYHLTTFDVSRSVSFSEFRNTDQIVVYTGRTIDFSMQGNVPSEDVYNNKKFF